jgi:hypothetical protein
MDQQAVNVTPRTDREVYRTTVNDVGFTVVNPALCRELELAIRRAHDYLAPLYDGCDPATYDERDGIDEAFLILRAALRGEIPRWRHAKRGSTYLQYDNLTIQTSMPLGDGDTLVTYRDEEGRLWGRPPTEFADGRFEGVSP